MPRQIEDVDTGQRTDMLVETVNANVRALAGGEGVIGVRETVATTVAVDEDDEILLIDATAGAVTATLPFAVDFTKRRLVVRHTAGAHNVTLNPQAADQIDSGSIGVGISLNSVGDTAELVTTNNTTWHRIR